jgi:hypothetical protein
MPVGQMAILGTDLDSIEVTYKTPIVSEKGRVLKKTVSRKSILQLSRILIIDEDYDSKGNLVPDTCRVYYEYLGWLILEVSYPEMSKYKLGTLNRMIGFHQQQENKKHGSKGNTRKNA